MLKQILIAACLALPLTAVSAQEKKALTPQQQRMGDCNKEAAAKKLEGDARSGFMQKCLSADGKPTAAQTTQQEKMTACNKTAGEKKLAGDERKKFMSSCLSG